METAWFWTAYVACGALCLLAAFLGSRRRRLRPVDLTGDAAAVECAACGYDVRGLPDPICPECGSDLRDVGRVTPQFRRWQKFPPRARAVFWTLCIALIGMLTLGLAILNVIPMRQSATRLEWLFTPPALMAESQRRFYELQEHRDFFGPAYLRGGSRLKEQAWEWRERAAPDRWSASLRIYQMQPGSSQQPASDTGVEFAFNKLNQRWELRNETRVIDAGSGLPPPQVALRLVELGRTDLIPAKPVIVPATESISASRRDRIEAGTIYLRIFVPLARPGTGPSAAYKWLPEAWRAGEPVETFLPTYGTEPLRANLLALRYGGANYPLRPVWTWVVPAVGFWLLVWAVGLKFVTRRRALKAHHDVPPVG